MQLWGTVGLLRRVCGRSLPRLFGVFGAPFGGFGSTLGVTFSAPQRGSLAGLGLPGLGWPQEGWEGFILEALVNFCLKSCSSLGSGTVLARKIRLNRSICMGATAGQRPGYGSGEPYCEPKYTWWAAAATQHAATV